MAQMYEKTGKLNATLILEAPLGCFKILENTAAPHTYCCLCFPSSN